MSSFSEWLFRDCTVQKANDFNITGVRDPRVNSEIAWPMTLDSTFTGILLLEPSLAKLELANIFRTRCVARNKVRA